MTSCKDLIAQRRREAINLRENRGQYTLATELEEDADIIETLMAQLEQIQNDIRRGCATCKFHDCFIENDPCASCSGISELDNHWQWRGPQKGN